MSIHSWEFADPGLAKTYLDLKKALRATHKDAQSIESSLLLSSEVKTKLIRNNRQTEVKITQRLQRLKLELVDYYDKQTDIVTKEIRRSPRQKIHEDQPTQDSSKIIYSLANQTIKKTPTGNRVKGLFKYTPRKTKILQRVIRCQQITISRLKRCNSYISSDEKVEELTIKITLDEEHISLLKLKVDMLERLSIAREEDSKKQRATGWRNPTPA